MSEQQPEEAGTESPQPEESSSDSGDSGGSGDSGDSGDSGLQESAPGDIGDDQLPEDLQPTEDNPLARHPGQTGDDDDKIGSDTGSGDAANPSANMAYRPGKSNAPSEDLPGESGDDKSAEGDGDKSPVDGGDEEDDG